MYLYTSVNIEYSKHTEIPHHTPDKEARSPAHSFNMQQSETWIDSFSDFVRVDLFMCAGVLCLFYIIYRICFLGTDEWSNI